jgi:hypothetical protein
MIPILLQEILMANARPGGGRSFSKRCLIQTDEGEIRVALLRQDRENSRIAPIGPDGLTLDRGRRVPTSELSDIKRVDEVLVVSEESTHT